MIGTVVAMVYKQLEEHVRGFKENRPHEKVCEGSENHQIWYDGDRHEERVRTPF